MDAYFLCIGSKSEAVTNIKLSKDEKCCICLCPFTNKKILDKCGHSFCTDCIDKAFKVKKQCPICYQAYGPLTGDQPEGKMIEKQPVKLTIDNELHAGIKICYEFPDGIQGPDHPNPGKPYKGTSETAYLLYSNEGNKVLRLLRRAFDKKWTFTIGQSPTAIEDVVMFTDIPHITSR